MCVIDGYPISFVFLSYPFGKSIVESSIINSLPVQIYTIIFVLFEGESMSRLKMRIHGVSDVENLVELLNNSVLENNFDDKNRKFIHAVSSEGKLIWECITNEIVIMILNAFSHVEI